MIIKDKGYNKVSINQFDLLGNNENALSKAFAFTLANEPKALFKFLHYIGIKTRHILDNFKNISIEIEKTKDDGKDGRTDIEIKWENKFHIIIESKIDKNKATKQQRQYLSRFNDNQQNILCLITQERNLIAIKEKNIDIVNIRWIDIINLLNDNNLLNNNIVNDFLKFVTRSYKMNTLKEVSVQDLKITIGIKRFKECFVYKSKANYAIPSYFAPYFTNEGVKDYNKTATLEEKIQPGIWYIAKVLCVLTLDVNQIKNEFKSILDNLKKFAEGIEYNKEDLVEKWKRGIKDCEIDMEDADAKSSENENATYYFLSEPIKLKKGLLKSPVDNSKGWIGGKIPIGRDLGFDTIIKKIVESCS